MATYEIRETINAPTDKVFAMFADLPSAADNIESIINIEFLSEQHTGLGTRWKETRKIFGKEQTEEMWISDYQEGRSYTVSSDSCGSDFTTVLDFAPSGGGTEVVMTMFVKPRTMMAKVMSPLGFFFAGVFKKCMKADIDDLRQKLTAA